MMNEQDIMEGSIIEVSEISEQNFSEQNLLVPNGLFSKNKPKDLFRIRDHLIN